MTELAAATPWGETATVARIVTVIPIHWPPVRWVPKPILPAKYSTRHTHGYARTKRDFHAGHGILLNDKTRSGHIEIQVQLFACFRHVTRGPMRKIRNG